MSARHHVVVVGGGISGLAAAYRLVRASNGLPIDVTVLEAAGRIGGKLRTVEVSGVTVEGGADSFVVRKPEAVELCKEVGLGGELVVPAETGAHVWARRGLVPFMERSAFGIPADVEELLRWPGMSLRGRLRAARDLVMPAAKGEGDESIGGLVERRLGPEAVTALTGPLLAGLHAGDPYDLSVAATFPELQRWERDHGSLIRGAKAALKAAREAAASRSHGEAAAAPAAMFATVWGGLTRLVETLESAVGEARIRRDAPVSALRRRSDGGWTIETGAERMEAEAVVLAAPAFEAARLLRHEVPGAARELEAIPYVSTAVVALTYGPGTAGRLPEGTGFVVPVGERTITACTFVSRKWPDERHGDRAVLRCFVGRAGAEECVSWPDERIVEAVAGDVERATGLASPEASVVVRWPRAMPQYEVGHLDRLARIEAALATVPGVFVTGSAYRGVGIADCIRQATEAASRVREYLHGLAAGRVDAGAKAG